jgi:hypothetical protein
MSRRRSEYAMGYAGQLTACLSNRATWRSETSASNSWRCETSDSSNPSARRLSGMLYGCVRRESTALRHAPLQPSVARVQSLLPRPAGVFEPYDASFKRRPICAGFAGLYGLFLLQDECVPLFGVAETRSGGARDNLRLGCHYTQLRTRCEVIDQPLLAAAEGEEVPIFGWDLSGIQGRPNEVKRSAAISRNLLPYAGRKAPRDRKLAAKG